MNNYPCNNVKVPISGWVDLHPFKAWCLQILPTIFDESMSYYECLCKLLDIVSATIDDVNLLGQEFVKLKEYVDNYFTNLDVQTEINNKLDEMTTNGTLASYIRKYIGPYQTSQRTIMFFGDSIINLSHIDGSSQNLPSYIGGYMGCKVIDLTTVGSSLTNASGLSYLSLAEEYFQNGGEYPDYVVVFPSQYDCNLTNPQSSAINKALEDLSNVVKKALYVIGLIPSITDNIPSYNKFNKLLLTAKAPIYRIGMGYGYVKTTPTRRSDGTYTHNMCYFTLFNVMRAFGYVFDLDNFYSGVFYESNTLHVELIPIYFSFVNIIAKVIIQNNSNNEVNISQDTDGFIINGIIPGRKGGYANFSIDSNNGNQTLHIPAGNDSYTGLCFIEIN